ncbi:kinase-like domain-containing protein [Emericellopsis atlantica]|uniref:non-specific serine/threonine protein kinase n=1 Tax=Emericellopsis atlantica TaxID=2614577 RepID=A0A9P7ZN44_9HYPO|nr:kinase-like domain-containing protein [Emericellopsis atlantica]KAG9255085.1 kinase-like domain-containing protein [Emericellopsis atlantica]
MVSHVFPPLAPFVNKTLDWCDNLLRSSAASLKLVSDIAGGFAGGLSGCICCVLPDTVSMRFKVTWCRLKLTCEGRQSYQWSPANYWPLDSCSALCTTARVTGYRRNVPQALLSRTSSSLGLPTVSPKEQDRIQALFGDSPPPRRQPAPYPEGDVLYRCNNRYLVRHGNNVTKYTTFPDGLGAKDHPNEAQVLRFVKEHTTIPVPEVISSDWDRITMEYIEGQTLQQAWPVLTPEQRSDILAELSGYIAQMRALGGIHLGRLDGQGVVVPIHDWLVRPPKRLQAQSMYWHQITTQLGTEYPIVFTHGDLASRNILVRDGHIVALLDWEFAGWYPEYWEYVFALRGMDKLDWETLGSHLPSLFTKRYDLEYILLEFIISIS